MFMTEDNKNEVFIGIDLSTGEDYTAVWYYDRDTDTYTFRKVSSAEEGRRWREELNRSNT